MLIHFDGWSEGYDYWAPTDHKDLHPPGFMAQRGRHHTEWQTELWSPKGESGVPNGESGAPKGESGAPSGQSGPPNGESGAPNGESGAPNGELGL